MYKIQFLVFLFLSNVEAFCILVFSSPFFVSFSNGYLVAEKEFKTAAFENTQAHGGSYYGADNSNYNRNYYQVII